MMTPLDSITATMPLSATAFPATSRYNGVPIVTLTTPDNRKISYLQRRILPSPSEFTLLQLHVVTQGERMDSIAARYLGDPEQYWRICDANGAMRPEDLTARIGWTVRITLPQGVPGTPNA